MLENWVVEILPFFCLLTLMFIPLQLLILKTKQMVKTNFSNQTTDAVLTEQQYRIEALQNKIEELKAILEVNNLI